VQNTFESNFFDKEKYNEYRGNKMQLSLFEFNLRIKEDYGLDFFSFFGNVSEGNPQLNNCKVFYFKNNTIFFDHIISVDFSYEKELYFCKKAGNVVIYFYKNEIENKSIIKK